MTTTEHQALTALLHVADEDEFWYLEGVDDPDFRNYLCNGRNMARDAIPALEALIAERDELRQDASLLRCLITSSRFRNMAVDDAMTELRRNGLKPSAAIDRAKETQG